MSDTGTLIVVVGGEMHFDIAAQDPIAATRGSIVNILRTTPYAYEVYQRRASAGEYNAIISLILRVLHDHGGPVSLPGVHGFQIRESGERFVGRDMQSARPSN